MYIFILYMYDAIAFIEQNESTYEHGIPMKYPNK